MSRSDMGGVTKNFTSHLQVVQDILPEEITLPKSYYQANNILCPKGMDYQKIHASPNDCILYKNEFEEIHNCPR